MSKKSAQGSLKLLKKFNQKEAAQGSLEYIIIIGGIIIMSVATYFMLRSFSQTSSAGTSDTIGVAGETLRLELENLGRSEISFSSKSWGSFPQASTLDINNSGSSTTTELALNNLSDYGLDTDNLEFAYNDSGSMQFLPYTHASPVNVTLPDLGTGITLLFIFHNNSSALELDNVNHSSPEPSVTVEDGTEPVERPDNSSPTISIPSIVEGPLDSIEIEVNISGTGSRTSESYHSIENSPWIPADNYYYEYGGITSMAYPSDGSYDEENETVRIFLNVPSEDNYTVKIRALDEYGNEKVETQEVEIVTEIPPDTTPPAILSSQPANNSRVTDLSLTINISTDETAHCRFSNASGTGYSSMTDFNNTDSTVHNITGLNLSLGQNYKYYFKCNDTSGNVNPSDYVLNFTAVGWGQDVLLSSRVPILTRLPGIALSGTNVHLVWQTGSDGNNEIYYKNSSDKGITWGPDYRLTNDSAESSHSHIGVSGNNVHVVWRDKRHGDYEIYYKNSSDGGATWGNDSRLTNDSARSNRPDISVNGNNLHVIWQDVRDGNYEIYYKNSSDGGATWGNDSRLTNDSSLSSSVSVALNGSTVHLTWCDNSDGNTEIYYKNSSDGGITWGPDLRLTNDPALTFTPGLGANGDKLHLVFHDNRTGEMKIYYKNSSDAGTTWSPNYMLSTANSSRSSTADIAVNGDKLHVVFFDNQTGVREVYYTNSSDGGVTWSSEYLLSTADSADSHWASVAADGDLLHVVRYDNSSGNSEVYYKRYYPG